MAKTRGTGLLMVWADIDPEFEAEYHRWYDEEHIAHLLAVPGFLSAGRYVAVKGGPKYLAMYELEAPDVLRSPAFLDGVRFRPSARRVQYSGGTIGRNYLMNGYRQIFPVHTNPIEQTRGRRRFCRWAGSTSRRWSRRNSTTGTTPPISRPISRCPAASAHAASSRSTASRNT